ncbi:MAG: TonB-dependent receptor [Candidatus Marinimicrobia bacterium]|nr:TonB-dependent receptor [Candidatus Neomarinimicrobiota bacterium]
MDKFHKLQFCIFSQATRWFTVIFLLLLVPMGFAGVTGKVSGTITHAKSGDPIIGATVQLIGTNHGRISDQEGRFIILNIPPGTYDLAVNFIGLETILVEDMAITVDLTTRLELTMNEGLLEGEEVIVVAPTVTIQKDLTATMSVVTQDQLSALPLADVGDALALQAGVVGSGSNLNVRGGRSNEVAYLIDGMYVQDPLLGGLATELGNDAIQELSLLSGTFNAEYGNALSGVVNIVTRVGGDHWKSKLESRSGIYTYGKTYEDEPRPDQKAEGEKYNWLLSGPLVKGKLYFFLTGETSDLDSYLPFGYSRKNSHFSKLTYTGFSALRLTAMYRQSTGLRQNYSHDWKLIPDQYYSSVDSSQQIGINVTHTLSERMFHELRISRFQQTYRLGILLDDEPTWKDSGDYNPWNEYQLDPVAGNGHEFYSQGDPPSYIHSRSQTYDLRWDLVWQLGRWNEIKTGIQYKSHDLNLLDIYDPKRDHPYIDDYSENPYEAAAYIQDKIEFPYLVINLGLRYDYMFGNASFRNKPLDPATMETGTPRSQVSPRLGIAHPISDRTKIHFAYGHFFQNPEYQYLYENSQYDISVREPIFGQPNLDAERTVAYEVGLSHQFTPQLVSRFTAYYKDITGLIGTHYFPAYTDAAPDQYVGYTLIVNEDYANTKGFELNLDYDASRQLSASMTYTFSVAKGTASSESEQYPGSTESTRLYYLSFDKTHGFNLYGSYGTLEKQGPKWLGFYPFERSQLGFILRASTGYPYTPSGRDVGFVERNSLRRPATYSLDFEASRHIALQRGFYMRVGLEVLNLNNVANIRYVYSDTGDPDYTLVGGYSVEYMRDPSNYGPPRTIRLGLTLGVE